MVVSLTVGKKHQWSRISAPHFITAARRMTLLKPQRTHTSRNSCVKDSLYSMANIGKLLQLFYDLNNYHKPYGCPCTPLGRYASRKQTSIDGEDTMPTSRKSLGCFYTSLYINYLSRILDFRLPYCLFPYFHPILTNTF